MPVFLGLATREEDGKEHGGAKVLIGFPDAKKVTVTSDDSGKLVSSATPNPHQRAMGLEDLTQMISKCEPGSENFQFFKQAHSALLSHIESAHNHNPAAERTKDQTKIPGLSINKDMRH